MKKQLINPRLVNAHGWLLLTTLFILLQGSAMAQKIFPISPILPDADQGQAYSVTFTIDGIPATSSVRWSYTRISGPALNTLGINFTGTDAQDGIITTSEISSSAFTNTPYRIRVNAEVIDTGGGVDNFPKDYVLVVWDNIPTPCESNTELALVLDASGSMGGSRWNELTESIKTYLPSLNDRITPTNNLEVIFFQGGGATTEHNASFSNVTWDDEDDIAEKIFKEGLADEVAPGGGTPMGAGIQRALNGFTAGAGTRRLMIVFTDGHQNRDPMFVSGSNSVCNTEINGSGDRVCTGGRTDLDDADVLVYTIGVGGGDQALLQDLAHPDNSYAFNYGTDQLDEFFFSTIPAGFRGCSPRMIDYRFGEIAEGDTVVREKFIIDSLVSDLTIRIKDKSDPFPVVFDNVVTNTFLNRIYDLELYKDGILTPFQPVVVGAVGRYYIEFPVGGDSAYPDGGGEWELRFKGPVSVEYEVAAMVEDKYFKTDVEVQNSSSLYAGDQISVKAMPTLVGQPAEGLTVVAFLLKPGEDLGDLASKTNFNGTLVVKEDSVAGLSESSLLARAKLDTLLQDPSILALLEQEGRIDTLVQAADGSYRGSFAGNENIVTGTYQLAVKYSGNLPGFGDIQGLDNRWYHVDFARPEDINLNLTISGGGEGTTGGNYFITFQPTNQFGKRLGPGQAHRIKVLVGNELLILDDNLDGSYSANVNVGAGKNPRVKIYIIDPNEPVEDRFIAPGQSPYKISAHGGYVTSLNSTAPLSSGDNGVYVELDFAYNFDQNWAISLIGGSYQFNNNISFIGASVFGEYTIRKVVPGTTGFYPRIAAGLGLYKPENQSLVFSLGLRPGLVYQVSPRLELSLDAGLHLMFDPGYQLGYGGVGLRYRL